MNIEIRVRELNEQDLNTVSMIASMCDSNCSKYDISRSFRRKNRIKLAVIADEAIVGFALASIYENFLELTHLMIHPDHRELGLGRKLLDTVTACMLNLKRTSVLTNVRETNLTAQLFLRSCGFRAMRVNRGFYNDTEEDNYQLEYRPKWTVKQTKNDKKGLYAKSR